MTMPNRCAIAVVLDRSGSMGSVRSETIEGFNEFLASQKQAPGEATLTLVQFDDQFDIMHDATPLECVQSLTIDTFVPRGTTALLDAIGRTIDGLGRRLAAMPEHERPGRVIVAIITDGMENASTRYKRSQVFDMITHQRRKYSWEFMFLAADQDAIAAGRELGINREFSASYCRGLVGESFGMMALKMMRARRDQMPMGGFSQEDRAKLMGDNHDAFPDADHHSTPAPLSTPAGIAQRRKRPRSPEPAGQH